MSSRRWGRSSYLSRKRRWTDAVSRSLRCLAPGARIWSLGVQTRRLLIVVSVLGVAASMFAVLRGAWLLALVVYAASIAVLCLLLWCASARTGGRTELA